MSAPKQRLSWLGSVISLLTVATCYGTLAAVSLLSLIGISVDIEEATLVKLITGLLVLALMGMVYSWRTHRQSLPREASWVFWPAAIKPGRGGTLVVGVLRQLLKTFGTGGLRVAGHRLHLGLPCQKTQLHG